MPHSMDAAQIYMRETEQPHSNDWYFIYVVFAYGAINFVDEDAGEDAANISGSK